MVHNPSGLYTAGAERFNSQPSVSLYANLLAKRQAKNDALDEYYKKLPSTINSAGMRDQSIPGFNEAVSKQQQYWIDNKEAIRKGNTPEAFNYDKGMREIMGKVNADKNAAKTSLTLGEMRFKGEKEYIFKNRKIMEATALHDLPIWDERQRSIDLGTLAMPPKPFDSKEQDAYYKSLTSDVEWGKKYDYPKSYTNKQTGQVIVPTIDVLQDDQIAKAANKAFNTVAQDESKQIFFDELLNSPNKKEWQVLQDAYTSFKDAKGKRYFEGDVDTPEKAAAADAIIKLSIPKKYAEEQEINYQQKIADRPVHVSVHTGSTKDTPKIDLRDYKDVEGDSKNITDLMRGVKVTGLPNGSSLLAESVIFNPNKKTITYKEYTDKKDATPKTVSLQKFLQDIKTLNPQLDMKFLEGLWNPIMGQAPIEEPVKQPVKNYTLPNWMGGNKSKTTPKTKSNPLGLDL